MKCREIYLRDFGFEYAFDSARGDNGLDWYALRLQKKIIWREVTKCREIYLRDFGFEYAFARTTMFFIRDLMECIDCNTPMHRSTYDEPIDFLDGNGFKVEGNDTDGYKISLA